MPDLGEAGGLALVRAEMQRGLLKDKMNYRTPCEKERKSLFGKMILWVIR